MRTKMFSKVCIATLAGLLFFCQSLSAQNVRVSLDAQNAKLKDVIEQIEKQTRYLFAADEGVDVNQTVSVKGDNITLRAALDQIVSGKDLTYSINGTNIILSRKAAAKASVIKGQITDETGLSVPGASVFIKGTTIGTVTDVDGNFTLKVPAEHANGTLEINSLGYEILNLPISGRTVFNVSIAEAMAELESSVVTALGIKRAEKAVTYNVQTISSDAFKAPEANMVNSLAGKLAGVQVNATAGGAGGETKVVMRGAKSISGTNNALYVLDGIPLPTLSLTNPGDSWDVFAGANRSGDGISNINPEDIDNMSALVGPSAAALYGSKAANGVLMLTSRKGEQGFSVSYSNNTMFSTPVMLPKLQDSYGAKSGQFASWGNKLANGRSWNIKDFFQTGYNTQNSINLSTGADHSTTYFSASSTSAKGVIPNNDYRRYNFTFTHTLDFLNDKMHLSVLGMYIKVKEQNMLAGGQYYNPLIPLFLLSPGDDLAKYRVYERYDASRNFQTQYWPSYASELAMQNPYWIINRNMTENAKNRFLAGVSLSYDIADWIDVTARVRTDYNNTVSEMKNYASTNGLFAGPKGRYYYDTYNTCQTYADALVNIHKTFGENLIQLNAVAGAAIEDYRYTSTNVRGDLTVVPNLFTLANMDTSKGLTKGTINDQTQSVFATAQLGYKSMVFLDLTGRMDWSTALANTDYLPIFYPSIGLSAILTDIFNVKSDILTFAKVRGSYAEVGNAPLRFVTVPTYVVSGGTVARQTYRVADNFQPERTKSFEFGADARLFNSKLHLSATYYNSRTYNQVFTPEISGASAYSTIYINSGRVDNKGIEISAEFNQKIGPVEWNTHLIYSRNINKIVDMLDATVDGVEFKSDNLSVGGVNGVKMWLTKGGKIGDIYVSKLKTDEHGYIWVSPAVGSESVAPATNDGTPATLTYAGNINPSWTASWRNSFSWNGLTLSAMINARVGGVGVSLTEATLDSYGVSQRTADARDAGGVLVNGALIPAENYYRTIGGQGTSAIGAYYVYSMTNVRLSEASIGYDIPISKVVPFIKGLNLSLVGRNLLMIYCKAPFDPELVQGSGNYQAGIDYFMVPSTRSVGFSAKVTF